MRACLAFFSLWFVLGCDATTPPPNTNSSTSSSGGLSGNAGGISTGGTADIGPDAAPSMGLGGSASSIAGNGCAVTESTSVFDCHCDQHILTRSQKFPRSLVVDANNVYWTNEGEAIGEGTVMQVSQGGGNPITIASAQYPGDIAVDDTSVYWTTAFEEAGAIMKAPIGGGDLVTLVPEQTSPNALTVDDSHVYWTTLLGNVMKAPLDGGDAITLASDQNHGGGIAVDDTSVYWTATGPTIFDGWIRKLPLGGGTPVDLASGQASMSDPLAVDGSDVYWTGLGGCHTVRSVRIDGGAVTQLVPGSTNGMAIEVDNTHVYWINNDSGGSSILRTPKAGGPTERLTPGWVMGIRDIALRSGMVYWATTSGDIMLLDTIEGCRCAPPG